MIIAFEGIHGCGKSTQINIIKKWLENKNKLVHLTSWNSFEGLQSFNDMLKQKDLHTPKSLALIHALDFELRYNNEILSSEYDIVLMDRCFLTSYVREGIRGYSLSTLKKLYSDYDKPDLVVYFDIHPKIALDRMNDFDERSDYVVGTDLFKNVKRETAFHNYMILQDKRYKQFLQLLRLKYLIIDANLDVNKQIEILKKELETII